MARHRLTLRPEWHDAVRSGRKTIDARLVTDDVADLKVGQIVHYSGAEARVRHMRFYPTFRDLLAHEDWRRIDPDGRHREDLLRTLEAGHAVTIGARGVVALEIEPAKPK